MSTINTTCYPLAPEIESGAGEMKCFKPVPYASSSLSNIIVSEIVNDILENALDIVIANGTKAAPKIEKISSNVVGDILENILSTSSSTETRQDETVLLDEEIKQIIKEMKCPTEPKSLICTKGVGDQLGDKLGITPDKILAEPAKRNTLERKNRLTNLVRSSRQILSKFVTNESDKELKPATSEETHEKLIKIIDFDSVDIATCRISEPVIDALPEDLPSESAMDVVDLEAIVPEEPCKESEEEASGSSCKVGNKKELNVTRKKWNIGAKIMKYLRRHPKKEQKEPISEN